MGLRIRTNIASIKAQRSVDATSQALESSISKLSSGERISKAADDAAGLAISEHLRAIIRSTAQAKRNANDGVSLIQVAEGGINEVSNILIRLRELSIQSATDTINNSDRSIANKEYVALVDEIERISNAAEFNGHKIFRNGHEDGVQDTMSLHIGSGNGLLPQTDTIELDMTTLRLSPEEDLALLKGSAIGPEDIHDNRFQRETAVEKLSVLDNALEKVNGMRAELGAKQSRLSSSLNNLGVIYENLSAANSRIRDVDFASETATYTQSRILQQAGMSVLSQANQLPELALSLLRS